MNDISVFDLETRLASQEDFILVDVREESELRLAHIDDPRVLWLPLTRLSASGPAAIPEKLLEDRSRPVITFCHHGVRSANVAAWLRSQGWNQVSSLSGGIDAYARQIDHRIGLYGE